MLERKIKRRYSKNINVFNKRDPSINQEKLLEFKLHKHIVIIRKDEAVFKSYRTLELLIHKNAKKLNNFMQIIKRNKFQKQFTKRKKKTCSFTKKKERETNLLVEPNRTKLFHLFCLFFSSV